MYPSVCKTAISAKDTRLRVNEDIRVREVRLIDEEGKQVGIVSTPDALQRARTARLDLVEVSAAARPPVAKILDAGRYFYNLQKKQQEARRGAKRSSIKGVRIGFRIDPHDRDLRLQRADRFLTQGHKVKLELALRGREKSSIFNERARALMHAFIHDLPGNVKSDGEISKGGRGLTVILTRPGGTS